MTALPAQETAGRTSGESPAPVVRLGLAANGRQFTLLVVINAFVGAMVGLERAVLPLAAVREFGVATASAALSFVATFGLAKAFANLGAGWLVEARGRRATLILGWLLAIPVPFMIYAAPTWNWIVAANVLLGASQGLAWSSTVIMKIDLVGPRHRGFAMGLNEFAGYLAVAIAAAASGAVAWRLGLRGGPAVLGFAIAMTGLLLSVLFTRDTTAHALMERAQVDDGRGTIPLTRVLRRSFWADRSLFSVSQAGFVNNLNDGLAWGLFPLFFAASGLSVSRIALTVAIYPAVWGVSQLATGMLSDRWGRKSLIVVGMTLQGLALVALALSHSFGLWAAELIALGLGTALVYPALLAAVADIAHPSWRASAVGVYRLWRDLGYVGGALLAGALADAFGAATAIAVVGALTIVSGGVVAARLGETHASTRLHPRRALMARALKR